MRINPVSNISFKKCIKVKVSSNSNYGGGYKKEGLWKILDIANNNKVGVFIGEDVIILNSTPKIKDELEQLGYNFEEIGDVL